MIAWRRTGELRLQPVSQIAIRLRDELTGDLPIGGMQVRLLVETPSLDFVETDIAPVITSHFVMTWPGLERRSSLAGVPGHQYRVVVESDYYYPLYPLAAVPGLDLTVQPYNAENLPPIPTAPTELSLLPAPTYPFPSHVRVLRGRVRVQGTNQYVARALVREGARERVLTDDQGSFALPLRWPPRNAANLPIDADDQAGKVGTILINLPAMLGQSQTIDIS